MNSRDVSIIYKLTGKGWSECTINIYGQSCVVTASYLSNPLRDLVSAVNLMLRGGTEARFHFDEEPGEFRWIVQSDQKRGVSIQIIEFGELWGGKPDSEGQLIFEATCPARDLGIAMLETLNDLIEEYGLDGYWEKWGNAEFPTEGYLSLCGELRAEPSHLVLKPRRIRKRRFRS